MDGQSVTELDSGGVSEMGRLTKGQQNGYATNMDIFFWTGTKMC